MGSNTIALFADVSNLYYCVKKKFINRKLDYNQLLKKFTENKNLFRAYAYGSYLNDETKNFINCLKHFGYETCFNHPRIKDLGNGKKEIWKTNWDTTIAMDIVRIIDRVDTVVICSISLDLIPVIEWIKEQGVKIIVVGCHVPSALKSVSSKWVDLNETYLEALPQPKLLNETTETTE